MHDRRRAPYGGITRGVTCHLRPREQARRADHCRRLDPEARRVPRESRLTPPLAEGRALPRGPRHYLDVSVERLAELIRERRPCVVLTGAGISTESGIPDFRSA